MNFVTYVKKTTLKAEGQEHLSFLETSKWFAGNDLVDWHPASYEKSWTQQIHARACLEFGLNLPTFLGNFIQRNSPWRWGRVQVPKDGSETFHF